MDAGLYRAEIDYDGEFDLLSIRRPGFSTSFSIEAGNLVLDFTEREFVGLEVQNAGQWLLDLLDSGFSPKQLTGARIGFEDKKSFLKLVFVFSFGAEQLQKEVLVQKFEPVAIPA